MFGAPHANASTARTVMPPCMGCTWHESQEGVCGWIANAQSQFDHPQRPPFPLLDTQHHHQCCCHTLLIPREAPAAARCCLLTAACRACFTRSCLPRHFCSCARHRLRLLRAARCCLLTAACRVGFTQGCLPRRSCKLLLSTICYIHALRGLCLQPGALQCRGCS